MSIREEQKEQRRMEIILAALHLFEKRGYAATKVSDIAQSVGMSMGLLFHYFESKEKLYEEIIKIGLQGTRLSMEYECVEPLKFFEDSLTNILQSMKENPMVASMFIVMADAIRNSATPDYIREIALQVNNIDRCVDIIKRGQRKGIIKQGNPYALSNLFWCTIQGVAQQAADNPELPLPEVDWILDILRN